jgi:cold shock CspA family protein
MYYNNFIVNILVNKGGVFVTGRIKMFNSEKGYGFIISEDGEDRFFHVANVKSMELPCQGAFVSFTPSENEKGKEAKEIFVTEKETRPGFISIGSERIKLSNIKDYGLQEKLADFPCAPEMVRYTRRFLWISTYQNDEHEFYGNDIDKKLAELDKWLR